MTTRYEYSDLTFKMRSFLERKEIADSPDHINCNGDKIDACEAESAIQAFIDFITE